METSMRREALMAEDEEDLLRLQVSLPCSGLKRSPRKLC
jgi:hypothetical protein